MLLEAQAGFWLGKAVELSAQEVTEGMSVFVFVLVSRSVMYAYNIHEFSLKNK